MLKATLGTLALVVLVTPGAWAQNKPDATKGKEVYEQCAACHSATTTEKKLGPGLKGLYRKPKLSNGQKPSDAAVLDMVNKGKGPMPAFAEVLSAEEKANLLAYLKTL